MNGRESKFTNFVEVRLTAAAQKTDTCFSSEITRSCTADMLVLSLGICLNLLIFSKGLFFCICVDREDNELACLEAVHLFVEILDEYFGNVCELDLVFNFYKVYVILDEVFLAGELMETSKMLVRQFLALFFFFGHSQVKGNGSASAAGLARIRRLLRSMI